MTRNRMNDAITALAREIVADARRQAERKNLLIDSVLETLFDRYVDALWERATEEAYRVINQTEIKLD